jgi:hypothetical protein
VTGKLEQKTAPGRESGGGITTPRAERAVHLSSQGKGPALTQRQDRDEEKLAVPRERNQAGGASRAPKRIRVEETTLKADARYQKQATSAQPENLTAENLIGLGSWKTVAGSLGRANPEAGSRSGRIRAGPLNRRRNSGNCWQQELNAVRSARSKTEGHERKSGLAPSLPSGKRERARTSKTERRNRKLAARPHAGPKPAKSDTRAKRTTKPKPGQELEDRTAKQKFHSKWPRPRLRIRALNKKSAQLYLIQEGKHVQHKTKCEELIFSLKSNNITLNSRMSLSSLPI